MSDPDDHSIYPHVDGIRTSAPWRLSAYGEAGALSASDLSELGARFDLPDTVLTTLSTELGYCLDDDDDVAINLVEVNRAKALARAQTRLEKTARLARRVEADLDRMHEALSQLSPGFASERDDAILTAALNRVTDLHSMSQGLSAAIVQVIETPGAAADMSPRDRRRVWDKRRQHVVETCCHAWRDAGRELTYTTVPDGSAGEQRRGPLIDFIQAVVARVTDPSRTLSGETIRCDIDRLRDDLAPEAVQPDPAQKD